MVRHSKETPISQKIEAKLAHAQVVQTTTLGRTTTRLMPFHYLESHKGLEAYEKHTLKQIESYAGSFREIAAQIHKLQSEIKWSPKSPE